MAARPKRRDGDDDLPHELWREILNRLSVKSLLRCRSICKSWYSLVSCPDFISDYSTKNLNKNGDRVILQLCDKRTNVWSYSYYNELFIKSCEHDYFPEPLRGQHLGIVGSCNGLICLSKYDRDATTMALLIWNPTIKKVVEVLSCAGTKGLYHLGFGFDSKTNDYKVLCKSKGVLPANVFEIFDLGKGVWRPISPPIASWDFEYSYYYPKCYLDGVVHWNAYKDRHDGARERILLSFNMRDELFREVRMPDFVRFVDDNGHWTQTQSVTFSGLIHLIAWKEGYLYMEGGYSVWAMKEYGVTESWTKLFDIDLPNAPIFNRLNQFCLWKNGEVFIVHYPYISSSGNYHPKLLSYNHESRKCKRPFIITGLYLRNVILFEESLVLL